MARAARGALAKDPSKNAQTAPFDPTRAQTRIDYLKKVRPNDPQIKQLQQKLAQQPQQQQTPQGPATDSPQQPGYNEVTGDANKGLDQTFDQINEQGAFNPGSFADQQNAAYQHVVDQFNRTMDPQFQQQEQQMRQRWAEQGVDPNSEGAKQEYQQMQQAQSGARQNAMDEGYGAGLNAQAQGFGQAYQQWQSPYQALAAQTPFYGYQSQFGLQQGAQGFQANQADLDRQFQAAQQAKQFAQQKWLSQNQHGGGGGGGGGLSYEQQLGLLNAQQNGSLYNSMALLAMQGGQGMPQPNAGSGFAAGVGSGVGLGLGSMLMR